MRLLHDLWERDKISILYLGGTIHLHKPEILRGWESYFEIESCRVVQVGIKLTIFLLLSSQVLRLHECATIFSFDYVDFKYFY